MAQRTVTDTAGRTWTCTSQDEAGAGGGGDAGSAAQQGRDVQIACTTASVARPVHLTVGWQWERMAEGGLARLITTASPVPKR